MLFGKSLSDQSRAKVAHRSVVRNGGLVANFAFVTAAFQVGGFLSSPGEFVIETSSATTAPGEFAR